MAAVPISGDQKEEEEVGQHRILPWTVKRDPRSPFYGVFDANGVIVVGELLKEEAEFIVRACNAHHAIVSALRNLKNECDGVLSLCETDLRELVGHTNINCLERRIAEAREALASLSSEAVKTERADDWSVVGQVLDYMTSLMQPQSDGRYLDATETWNSLLDYLRTRQRASLSSEEQRQVQEEQVETHVDSSCPHDQPSDRRDGIGRLVSGQGRACDERKA